MKVNRNELCSCGSGKKHKNCCLSKKSSHNTSKVLLLALVSAMFLSVIYFGYNYLNEAYVGVFKFDFRPKYEYEYGPCSNPDCQRGDHVLKSKTLIDYTKE